jgi:haloacetate dehalogenase
MEMMQRQKPQQSERRNASQENDASAGYLRCYRNPACAHAVCEDYRASVTIDVEIHESANDRKAQPPLLAIWGTKGTVGQLRHRRSNVRRSRLMARRGGRRSRTVSALRST